MIFSVRFPVNQSEVVPILDSNQNINNCDGTSWFITLDNYSWIPEAVITDKSDNLYCAGVIDLGRLSGYLNPPLSVDSLFITKITNCGVQDWSVLFNYEYDFGDLEIDLDNNIYTLWNNYQGPSVLFKLNDAGETIWNCTLKSEFFNIYIDRFNNIHLMGYEWNYPDQFLKLIKIDKSGFIIYNHSISVDFYSPIELRVDSLNNTYIAVTKGSNFQLCKVNTSADLILIKELDQRKGDPCGIFDDYDNLYIFQDDDYISENVVKYNASGEKIFERVWSSYQLGAYHSQWHYFTIDEFGNIYCGGVTYYYTLAGFAEIFLVKYNENGSLMGEYVWRRDHEAMLSDLYVDKKNNIYFSGTSEEDSFIVKNPTLEVFSIGIFNFYLDEQSFTSLIQLSILFGVWILLSISFFIIYILKGNR